MNQMTDTGPMRAVSARKVIDVETLLEWTYRRQKADVVADHGVGLYRVERLAMGGVERSPMADSAAMIAEAVPGAGGIASASALHPDAETVHELVRKLPAWMRDMTIRCARTGSHPCWGEGMRTKLVPVVGRNGKPAMILDAHGHGIGCKVEVENPPEWIGKLRDQYLTWWQILAALALKLRTSESLVAHVVEGPRAAYAPWKLHENTEAERRLLTSARMFG